ncbi:MAG: transporter substrate-binding domain-containing protein [Oscillospiraceae bacterium]|nr:transporter substrate-binding domain-containing protein [Oscillospiraceae bacterium]
MKKWTKLGAVISAALLVSAMAAGCGSETAPTEESKVEETSSAAQVSSADWDDIAAKGKMTVGITYFEPMNYIDKDTNELTGFETEFAQAVCEKLGVEADFQKIEWESKEVELNAKTIDCIWNGMTITDERKENMDISVPYMENKQVMVVKKDNLEKYQTAEDMKGAKVVAEKKSAGEEVAQSDEFFAEADYLSVDSQAKTLLEVKSGTADVAIIDYVMSIGSLGEGSDYSDLVVVDGKDFAPEQYGIAFRKNSPATLEKVNAAIQELADEGKLQEIAEKYHLEDLLLVKPANEATNSDADATSEAAASEEA